MTGSGEQLDFSFGGDPKPDGGYARWQEERRAALERTARELGLPLGHRVDVELRDGTRLTGELRLASEELWIEARRDFRLTLRIDRCTFTAAEIAACVRLD